MVKSWRAYWDEIPECQLKEKAHDIILNALKGFNKAFGEAFGEGCKKRTNLVYNHPSPNQEQEQEQEQEQDKKKPPLSPLKFPPSLDTQEAHEAWTRWLVYKKTIGKPYKSADSQEAQLRRQEKLGATRFIAAVEFSIAQNYQGIFEENQNGKPRGDIRSTGQGQLGKLRTGSGDYDNLFDHGLKGPHGKPPPDDS